MAVISLDDGYFEGKGCILPNSWVGKIPWRKKWQPAPVFLPGKFHGQRSLVGHSPWGCKELNKTGQFSAPTHPHTHIHTLGTQ